MSVTSIQDLGLTRAREVVLEAIRENHEHLTASEVFSQARAKLPSISFATAYSTSRAWYAASKPLRLRAFLRASFFPGVKTYEETPSIANTPHIHIPGIPDNDVAPFHNHKR